MPMMRGRRRVRSICANSASLRSIRSGAASMTRSASCERLGRLVVGDGRASIASASAVDSLAELDAFPDDLLDGARALATASSDTSYIRVVVAARDRRMRDPVSHRAGAEHVIRFICLSFRLKAEATGV